jgi:antitoxin component YwqK of YwqJK toxin-antitoxin module
MKLTPFIKFSVGLIFLFVQQGMNAQIFLRTDELKFDSVVYDEEISVPITFVNPGNEDRWVVTMQTYSQAYFSEIKVPFFIPPHDSLTTNILFNARFRDEDSCSQERFSFYVAEEGRWLEEFVRLKICTNPPSRIKSDSLQVDFYANGKIMRKGISDQIRMHYYRSGRIKDSLVDDTSSCHYFAWYENGNKRYEGNTEIMDWYPKNIFERAVGKWNAWYENGQPKYSGSYDDEHACVKTGPWKEWYSNGQLEADYTCKMMNYKLNVHTYSSDCSGQHSSEGEEINYAGVIDGSYQSWYPNGQKMYSLQLKKKDVRDGKWLVWYSNGNVKEEKTYKNGEVADTLWMYYEDKSLCREEIYKNGILNEYDRDGKLFRDTCNSKYFNYVNGRYPDYYTLQSNRECFFIAPEDPFYQMNDVMFGNIGRSVWYVIHGKFDTNW